MAESAESTLATIRDLVSDVDMHRNREKREVLDAIRELVGVVEKAPEPAPVVEPEPVAEVVAEPTGPTLSQMSGMRPLTGDDLVTIENDGSGTELPPGDDEVKTAPADDEVKTPAEPDVPVKRGPGRPRKQPAIAED